MSVLFANITQWGKGKMVCAEISRMAPSVFAFCETHVPKDDFHLVDLRLRKQGYKIVDVDHAASTGLGGTSAGLCLATKTIHQAGPIDPAIVQEVSGHACRRWVAGTFRLKGASVIIVCLYLFVSEGMSARNLAILTQIALLVKLFKEPVLIMGDFNMVESDIQDWFFRSGLTPLRKDSSPTIVTPGGAQY